MFGKTKENKEKPKVKEVFGEIEDHEIEEISIRALDTYSHIFKRLSEI